MTPSGLPAPVQSTDRQKALGHRTSVEKFKAWQKERPDFFANVYTTSRFRTIRSLHNLRILGGTADGAHRLESFQRAVRGGGPVVGQLLHRVLPGFGQRPDDAESQHPAAGAALELLDETVLYRFARLDEAQTHALLLGPVGDCDRRKLGANVCRSCWLCPARRRPAPAHGLRGTSAG